MRIPVANVSEIDSFNGVTVIKLKTGTPVQLDNDDLVIKVSLERIDEYDDQSDWEYYLTFGI